MGLILLGIGTAVWFIIRSVMALLQWLDNRYLRRTDYERDIKERDHRVLTDGQRDKKFSHQIDRLIDAITKTKKNESGSDCRR